ncbi:CoA-acylating methylmalonate-semialdehyde dehydrogenase [Streptomyces sp. NBC_00878]|uniref:CoA-acylating methylmalonate-semialdehyde dehydrogenase n=1 Tax=Streptomyces sp. NBC_00878 TaxID=2975854 RepID=UPI002257EDD4|nr:CoA-acylating methylmalonate-semialdehyde dehydrogenase [Streptomyces sp. NBC_00878]MCX4909895.1 CoA-acylating methylmalonate-semialdehyde dehydrogenase [Streptomyces sp. NBC_00878]
MTLTPHWIGGRRYETAGDRLPVLDPATGQTLGEVLQADAEVVKQAVTSAVAAFPAWRNTTPARRAQVLYAFRNLLREHTDELAALVTAEHGKTLADARGEVARGIEAVELACGVPGLLKGEFSEQTGTNIDTYSILQPLGVCVGITPFNFPVMIPLMKIAVAVAAGNSFILKPSEQDPGVSVRLAELAKEAGLPDGVLSVVHGRQETAEALIDHPDTAAVSFVGSTPVAHSIYKRGAQAGKRVQALGGAKNHLVVMPDAKIEAAADALASAAFGSAGQRCMAITTAVVVGEAAEPLLDALKVRAEAVVMGAGAADGSEMGPLVSAAAQERVRGLVARAIEAGARPVVDRSTESVAGSEGGFFVGPTLLDNVASTSEIYLKEVFGPVLIVLRVDTLDEALELIRTNEYGNGAAIFTRSGAAARQFQREAAAGMVGVNVPIPVPVAPYSVAGWKNSIFGDTGLNNGAWRFYTQPKYVTSRWDEAVAGVDLGFRPN